jgi:hypothetical protein
MGRKYALPDLQDVMQAGDGDERGAKAIGDAPIHSSHPQKMSITGHHDQDQAFCSMEKE